MDTLPSLKVQSFAMAKEKSTDKEERKREKHAKKEKRSERDGVHKSKKDKKEKHREVPVEDENDAKPIKLVEESTEVNVDAIMTEALLHKLGNQDPESDMKVATAGDVSSEPVLLGALVPFANPLADEKTQKKVLKSIKKGLSLYYGVFTFSGLHCLKSALLTSPVLLSPRPTAAKNRCLKRGVKEVVKSLRKSATASASAGGEPPSIVVLAADISPMDVISHIPVLCEDHGVPYIFVPSRVELGAAGCTKRPTSVVMVSPKQVSKKKEGEKKDEGDGDFAEVYRDLIKVIAKASKDVKI